MADDKLAIPSLPTPGERYDRQNEAAFRREVQHIMFEVDAALARFADSIQAGLIPHADMHDEGGTDPLDGYYSLLGHDHDVGDITDIATTYLKLDCSNDPLTAQLEVPSILSDFVQFDLTYDEAGAEGKLQWDADDGALEYGLPGGNINLQIGRDMLIWCRNTTGSTIPIGSLVYMTGASGNKPLIALSDANESATLHLLGMTTEAIAHNANGYVTVNGLVSGVDTDGMAVGAHLYLSETAGEFTDTEPTAPVPDVQVGHVIAAHATEGVVLVSVREHRHLAMLCDASITDVASGELLKYNGSVWINQTLAEAGISASGHEHVEADITDLDKYTQAEVLALTWTESDITDLDKYTQAEVDALTWVEADITDLDKYTQAEVDALTWVEADITDLDKYTQAEVDALTWVEADITDLQSYMLAASGYDISGTFDFHAPIQISNAAGTYLAEIDAENVGGIWTTWVQAEGSIVMVIDANDNSTTDYFRVVTNDAADGTPTVLLEVNDDGSLLWGGGSAITDSDDVSQVGHEHVEADITDLGTYLEDITGEDLGDLADVTDASSALGWYLRTTGAGVWVAQAGLTEADVTAHEAALDITESQISDLGTYLEDITGEDLADLSNVTDASSAAGWYLRTTAAGTWVAQAGLTEADVTAHEAALEITEAQISDLTHAVDALDDIGDVDAYSSPASGEVLMWDGDSWLHRTLAEASISAAGHSHDHAAITGLDDDDHAAIYAAINAAKVITGLWDFDNAGGITFGTAAGQVKHDGSFFTVGSVADMYFLADSDNSSGTAAFIWKCDTPVATGGTTLMTLLQSSGLSWGGGGSIASSGDVLEDLTGEAFATLQDIAISAIADGELLQYNSAVPEWRNRTLAEIGILEPGTAETITGGWDFTTAVTTFGTGAIIDAGIGSAAYLTIDWPGYIMRINLDSDDDHANCLFLIYNDGDQEIFRVGDSSCYPLGASFTSSAKDVQIWSDADIKVELFDGGTGASWIDFGISGPSHKARIGVGDIGTSYELLLKNMISGGDIHLETVGGGDIWIDDGGTNNARVASVKAITAVVTAPSGDYPYGTFHCIY